MWHVNPNGGAESGEVGEVGSGASTLSGASREGSVRDFAEATATQSHNLMTNAATRVWEELYITKKPAIEEVWMIFQVIVSGHLNS